MSDQRDALHKAGEKSFVERLGDAARSAASYVKDDVLKPEIRNLTENTRIDKTEYQKNFKPSAVQKAAYGDQNLQSMRALNQAAQQLISLSDNLEGAHADGLLSLVKNQDDLIPRSAEHQARVDILIKKFTDFEQKYFGEGVSANDMITRNVKSFVDRGTRNARNEFREDLRGLMSAIETFDKETVDPKYNILQSNLREGEVKYDPANPHKMLVFEVVSREFERSINFAKEAYNKGNVLDNGVKF
ncbi:MAG TPA: hypothetical protein DIV86_06070 [Alphaproteobacteria bacterium]|nr:hypothetical protein [Alphaproteobacteria bacterium]